MVGLSNIVGGATIAAAVATAAGADGYDDNITTVQASPEVHRVELNDLPKIRTDLLKPQDEHFRNPGHRGTNSQPYDSLGSVDERRAPLMYEREYDPVVQMVTPTGPSCTATISNIEGFESREQGTIITTAAHCFDIRDGQGNVVGQWDVADITFKGSYLDSAGQIQEFSMQADEAWINPLYQENIEADQEFFQENSYPQDRILEADTAVVFSRQVTPDGVIPVRVLTTDFEEAAAIREAVYGATLEGQEVRVTVAGHAADKPYLTTHENTKVTYGDVDGINAESDIVPGSSGGPVLLSGGKDQPVALTEAGEPVSIGVNSTVTGDGTDFSRHSYFDKNALQTAPFLKPEGTSSDEVCTQTGEVTASSLKIRVGPDVSFQELARPEGQENSQIPLGSQVSIHGITQNELGQEWGLVSTPEGRTGYVSMNSDYVERGPEVCAPAAVAPMP